MRLVLCFVESCRLFVCGLYWYHIAIVCLQRLFFWSQDKWRNLLRASRAQLYPPKQVCLLQALAFPSLFPGYAKLGFINTSLRLCYFQRVLHHLCGEFSHSSKQFFEAFIRWISECVTQILGSKWGSFVKATLFSKLHFLNPCVDSLSSSSYNFFCLIFLVFHFLLCIFVFCLLNHLVLC